MQGLAGPRSCWVTAFRFPQLSLLNTSFYRQTLSFLSLITSPCDMLVVWFCFFSFPMFFLTDNTFFFFFFLLGKHCIKSLLLHSPMYLPGGVLDSEPKILCECTVGYHMAMRFLGIVFRFLINPCILLL